MKKPYRAVRRYSLNVEGRDFVVGDVHGCFSMLEEELASASYDPRFDRLFSVGDLVDRGPESASVLDAVRRHRIKAVRGNHEDMILRWYGGYTSSDQLIANGGEWFIAMDDESGRARRFANFMASLPYAIEIETRNGLVALLHADAPHDDWPKLAEMLESAGRDSMTHRQVLWQRARWVERKEREVDDLSPSLHALFGLPVAELKPKACDPHRIIHGVTAVIVGHTPVRGPLVRGNVINIDTGAVYGGALTVLDLNDLWCVLSCSKVP
ncbi:metallophosphoesterase [Burkholderia stabilis]|uniref:metallophosphoesterase n=1 Tax=Burkholderia stabilis TaxID=95485 RepID=UPI001F4B1D82|nr:metallophosphoesterase [Burkholderia stabilis]